MHGELPQPNKEGDRGFVQIFVNPLLGLEKGLLEQIIRVESPEEPSVQSCIHNAQQPWAVGVEDFCNGSFAPFTQRSVLLTGVMH